MSDRIEWFTITVPAGTPKTAPVTFPCVFQQGYVTEVDVKVPPGPSGTVGFFVSAGGSQYIPRTPGSFVMPDNDYILWPLSNAINSGSWAVVAYNTDIYPHTLQFGFQINELGTAHVGSSSPGQSSDALASSLAAVSSVQTPAIDPLSPDALIQSVQILTPEPALTIPARLP